MIARHLRKGVSRVEAMVKQPFSLLIVMHCQGSKHFIGVAHARATAVVTTPGNTGLY